MWALGGLVKVTRTTHRSLTCSRRIVIRRPEWRIVIRHEQQRCAKIQDLTNRILYGILTIGESFHKALAGTCAAPGRREETDLLRACPIEYGLPGRFSRPAVPWGSVPPPDVRPPAFHHSSQPQPGTGATLPNQAAHARACFPGPPAPVQQALPRAASHCRKVCGPGVVPLTSGQHQAR